MAQISRAQRKNIFRLLVVASLILGGYSLNTLLTNLLWYASSEKYTISEEGSNTNQIDVELNGIDYDLESILEALFNSLYFDGLNESEQMDLFSGLLGDAAASYFNESGMTAGEFMDEFGEDIAGVFGSLSGGDSFDSSMLDSLPPGLAGALLAKLMFNTYEIEPISNPWNDKSETLFKIAAYDYYNTSSYDWEVSDTLDNSQSLALQSNSNEKKWKIKFPIMANPQVTTGLPAVSPNARVQEYTPSSVPLYTASVDLKNQLYLGGMTGEASYSQNDVGDFTNITYNLLYDSNDYESETYYRNYGYTMAQYTGGNLGVSECMKGPQGASGWVNYKNSHPHFAIAVAELEATTDFINAGDNVYKKTQAIVDYVGANFLFNPGGLSRPGEFDDPIEWLCETRESALPYEFTSLTVALARFEGLSVRYVSGYKWDDSIASQYGGSYLDPDEGEDAYPYLIANSMTWIEVFIPTSESAGDWVEFDNNFTATPPQPTPDELDYILTFDGSYYPEMAGYDRGSEAVPKEIDIEVSTSYNGNPLTGMEVVMKDVSYDNVIKSVYTDSNGIASFTLSLLEENMVSGPHVLNFSSEYMGVPLGNVSVISVVEDFDIYLTNASPDPVNSAIDTEAMLSIQGYVWDSVVDAPIKNAYIWARGVKEGDSYIGGDAIEFIPNARNVSNINGNFTFNISMIGWEQANYSIYTEFKGVFNILNDIQQFDPLYQSFLTPFEWISTHSAYPNEDNYDYIEFLDANYIEYTFTLNNTSSVKGASTTYPTGPTIGYRDNSTFNFSAQTYWGTDWVAGAISVHDETEDIHLANFATVALDGQGSTTYNLSLAPAANWTIGPHLIRIQWTDAPHTAIGRFWVFIKGDVVVDQTSDIYPDGRGGPTGGKYFINSGTDPAYADEFNITGYLRDAGTGESLQNYEINYRMFDNTWTAISSSFIELDALNEVIPNNESYYANFRFSGSTNVNLGPIHTDSYFMGDWDPAVYDWDNSWNALWDAFYTSNVKNDTSTGSFELSDPTDFTFTAHLDNVRFIDTVTADNRLKGTGTIIQISCEILHEGVAYTGIQVNLTDTSNSTDFTPISTDINGYSNFTFSFSLSDTVGTHSYRIYLDTGVGIYEDTINIIYDPTANYEFEGRYDLIPFASASPSDLGVGESFQLSGEFLNNSVAQSGSTVVLKDNGVVIDSDTTDSNGYVNFTVSFGSGDKAGIHTYLLEAAFPGGSLTDSIAVTFDPYLNYTFSPMLNGILFSAITGPSTYGKDDILNFSCTLTFEGSPKVGETVYLYDVTSGETLINSADTDGNGYYEYLLTLNTGTYLGSHDYEIRTDFLTNETTVIFDPELYYGFTARLNGTVFSSTAPADTRINSSGESVDISVSLLHHSAGQSGADVTLTDITTGTVWTGVTGGDGCYNFTITYNSSVNPGPHKYHISLTYNGGYFSLSGSNYEDEIWVIYNNALDCQSSRPDWNEVLGIGDTLQTITITGTLYHDSYSLGYNYAELTYWILQGGSVVNNHAEIFSVDLSWDTNSQNGTFTAYVSLIGAIEPSKGNYSIIIGFDGTLDITDSGLTYNAKVLEVNATGLEFTIFDKPYLTTSFVYDTVGDGFIIGGTHLNISGTLYYSNGTAVSGTTGQTVTINFYDENDNIVHSIVVDIDSDGNFEETDILMDWDATYYTVSYDGDDTESFDAANTITEPLVE